MELVAEHLLAVLARSQVVVVLEELDTAAATAFDQAAEAQPEVDTALVRSDYTEFVDSYTSIILTLTESVKLRTRISYTLRMI